MTMSAAINLLNLDFDQITFEQVSDFCQQKVIEHIQLDYKKALPPKLAKHIAAFSNTKGGLIVVGVEEDSKTGEPKKWEGVAKDGKLIDQVYQQAANVVPYPTIKVRFTNEISGKAFLLIRIVEGGAPPYHTVSDPTIWVRTGNISTPLDSARQTDLDRLYKKKDKAEGLQLQNHRNATEIYQAALRQGEKTRQDDFAKGNTKYEHSLLEHTSILKTVIQPFFPEESIAPREEILNRITDYRVAGLFGDFPRLDVDRCPGGIVHFNYSWTRGNSECQMVFENGLILNAVDIRYANGGGENPVMWINMNHIAVYLARQLKVAANYYGLFSYTGMLTGSVELSDVLDLRVEVLCPEGYHRDWGDRKIAKLNNYSWPIGPIDTNAIQEREGFYKAWKLIMDKIHWDLGLQPPSEELYRDFFDKNLRLFK